MDDKKQQIKAMIEAHDKIIIFRHRSPDLDSVGSQMALKHAIKQHYPHKEVLCYGDEQYYDFNFVGVYDQVSDKEIKESLVIVTDTANAQRISSQKYLLAKVIIKIDHHQDLEDELYGVINYVDQTASSTCEVLYYIFKYFEEFIFNVEIARCLFIGMYADTGGFSFPNTKPKTFEALSKIVSYDFDYEQTVTNIKSHDLATVKIIGYAYQNLIIENGVGHILFSKKFQRQHKISPQKLSIVANFLGIIKELEMWAVFIEYNDFVRVNMRSRKKYDISKVAVDFRGGGHKNASGAMLENFEQVSEILERLNELI